MNSHNEPASTAAYLAEVLGEHDLLPMMQIQRIVEHLGSAYAHELLAETQQIEANGGVPVSNGSRRRTPGGTFFWLTRRRLRQEGREEDLHAIFPDHAFRGPPGIEHVPNTPSPRRPRRRNNGQAHPRRQMSPGERAEAVRRLSKTRPDQSAIFAALEEHFGTPPDLYRRSIDPNSGAVTLYFHFPDIAHQQYAAVVESAAEKIGVPVVLAPNPHQGALMEAARAHLPPDLQSIRQPSVLLDQQTVRVRCVGQADDDALQAAQQRFQAATAWHLDIVLCADEPPPAYTSDPVNQQHALQQIRAVVGDDAHRISVYSDTHTIMVRFFFPDVMRERYADQLYDLEQHTGWHIEIHPEANQDALRETVRKALPARAELIREPSLYRELRHIQVICREPLTAEEQQAAQQETLTRTGWQLLVEA